MDTEPYAKDPLFFYPGRRLSEEERRKVDDYELPIDGYTVDHLIYAMSRQIENNFQVFYKIAEEIVGIDTALAIAREIGQRYGGGGYAQFLASQSPDGKGGPRMMALYQDLVHSIRGPKHTAALFAQYDENETMVERKECIYYSEKFPENGKYVEAFEAGCFKGYQDADPDLKRVDVVMCRFSGDRSCEQHWVYRDPQPAVQA
jgi:hypothetical protein